MRCRPSRQACRRAAEVLLVALTCLALGLLFVTPPASASTVRVKYEDTMDEVQVTEMTEVATKAAFLLRFPDFVRWPTPMGDTLHIGVSGDDALLEVLAQLAEQENERRPSAAYGVAVIGVTAPAEARECEVLVLGEEAVLDLLPPLAPAHPAGTLSVGIWDESRDGAIIRLFRDGDRVRFEISQTLAQEAGLQISSKLLNLARNQSDRSQ